MKHELKQLDGIALETLAEMANEAGEQVEKQARNAVVSAVAAGNALEAAKKSVPHGEWLSWLGKNWNYSQQTASRYMAVSLHFATIGTLKDAKNVNDALRIISEHKEAETPRDERKTGRVEVVTRPAEPVGQQVVQAEKQTQAKADENAVAAEPKTNTYHRPETAKAQVSRRPAPTTITPEIVEEPAETKQDDDPFRYCTFDSIIEIAIGKLSERDDQRKQAAKKLRKLADKLDPPTKFVPPTIEEVEAYCKERRAQGKPNDVDAEAFIAHYEKQKWKQSNGLKLENWRAAIITW